MIRYVVIGSLMTALGLCLAEPAFAYQSGVVCNPARTDADKVNYSQWGVHNESGTAPAQVFCSDSGLGSVPSYLRQFLLVGVYDRDPNSNVCCTAFLEGPDGTPYSSARSCSSGFGASSQYLLSPLAQTFGAINMICDIPPNHPTNGSSHVASFVPQLYS
jgi:hypothetical protein